jgi:hypothetical protein
VNKAIKLIIAICLPIIVGCFAYVEFRLAPYSDLRFKLADQSNFKIYEPHTSVQFGIKNRKASINSKGLIGAEIDQKKNTFVLSIGTCTLLDTYKEVNDEIADRKLNIQYLSGSLGHISIREVIVQLKQFKDEIKPDVLIVPLATVLVRDIEFYNKDYYDIPASVIRERAFNYREGDLYSWLEFSWDRKLNQLYFAKDRETIEPFLLKRKKQDSFDPSKTVKKNLEYFTHDVKTLASLCKKNHIRLITQTAPFNWDMISTRQQNMLMTFNNRIHKISKEQQFEVIDLSAMQAVRESDNYYYDAVHLNQKGATTVARIVVDYLEKNVL